MTLSTSKRKFGEEGGIRASLYRASRWVKMHVPTSRSRSQESGFIRRFSCGFDCRFARWLSLKKVCRRLGILHVWASTFGRVGVLRCRLAPAREAWPHVTHRALLPLSERVKEGSQNAPPPEEVAHRLPEEDRTRLSQSISDVRSRRHRAVQPHLKRRPIHPSSIVSAQRRSRSAKGQIKLIGSAIFFRARCQYLRWRRR